MSDPNLRETLDVLRKNFEPLMDPSLVEKFGDPFDPDDIRNVLPSARRKRDPDLSIEDEVYYLALDIEVLQRMLGILTQDYYRRRLDERRVFGADPGSGQYV